MGLDNFWQENKKEWAVLLAKMCAFMKYFLGRLAQVPPRATLAAPCPGRAAQTPLLQPGGLELLVGRDSALLHLSRGEAALPHPELWHGVRPSPVARVLLCAHFQRGVLVTVHPRALGLSSCCVGGRAGCPQPDVALFVTGALLCVTGALLFVTGALRGCVKTGINSVSTPLART